MGIAWAGLSVLLFVFHAGHSGHLGKLKPSRTAAAELKREACEAALLTPCLGDRCGSCRADLTGTAARRVQP